LRRYAQMWYFPEKYAAQIVQELLTEGASEFVAPEVPTLIQERLGEDTRDDPEAKNKRLFDVEALVTRVSGLLYSVTHHLPRLAATADAGHTLWNRVWVPLREFLWNLDLL
jgi:hypothetical protein